MGNNGLIGVSVGEDDEVMGVGVSEGRKEMMIGRKKGLVIRLGERDVGEMGRSGGGVKGIRVRDEDVVVGMEILEEE